MSDNNVLPGPTQPVDVSEAIEPIPSMPPLFGATLDASFRHLLHEVLWKDNSQLGSVYRAHVRHPSLGPSDLTEFADTANAGATSNRLAVLNALLKDGLPGGPTTAQQAASSVRALRRRTTNASLKTHYNEVLDDLALIINDEEAQEQETAQLEEESAELSAALETSSGVYVYTYLQYWRFPYGAVETRRLLKVGRTSGEAWKRVQSQVRQTGLPEEPILLRVYVADNPVDAEGKFHTLLDAAEHERSQGKTVGREWFATTIEYLDTIAKVLGYEVKSAKDPLI